MKAEDLMIGDKLKTVFSQKIVEVKEIKQNCIYTKDNGYEYNEIEPIPLTSEILEKNGFVKLLNQYVLKADKEPLIHLILLDYLPNANGKMLVAIKDRYTNAKIAITYVHELQHALRLCGIGKEIEL